MKPTHPLLVIVSILLFASLACTLGQITGDETVLPLKIDSVSVSPTHGTGDFTGTVKITMQGDKDTLKCYVNSNTGAATIGVFSEEIPTSKETKEFSFNFSDGETGTHKLMCTNSDTTTPWQSVEFTVDPVPASDPPQDQTNAQPVEISATGTVSGTNSWGDPFSVPTTSILVTIQPDNSVILYAVYTMNVDFVQEQYMYFWGTADPADGTITFTTCNNAGAPSGGTLSYTSLPLTGEYTCFQSPAGGITEEWKLKMP